ncbi:MAG TPA: DUF1800 domain-containing protein [Solirubrobacteraceae bacterium]|nr:DUF1800 domain-containing protein [Solirubrobacteraceae bacterium]
MTRTRPAALRELKASHGAHKDSEAHHPGKPGHSGKPAKHGSAGKGKHKLHKHTLRKHKHKHKRKHKHRPKHHAPVSGLPGAPAPPMVPVNPPAPSPNPPPVVEEHLTLARARRLLWRAGFGPAPGQAEALVGNSVQQVVFSLTRPSGTAALQGPEPHNDEGEALQPADNWGDDHCWWLDRMIRSDQPLVERMTYIWHDWFANSNEKVNDQQFMLDQNNLFREQALGNFHELFLSVTTNPAMLIFLDGIYNSRWEPNENYAREMMELFSLGADRGAYTEDDVKGMARALTGWTAEWTESSGLQNFHFEAKRHDPGTKTVFGQSGKWNYEDAVSLCVNHPLHPSYFVSKLWSYFVPVPPPEATLASLQGLYISSGYSIRAVVEAILQSPEFLDGPEMVTPPVVYNVGLLRAVGRYIDTTAWTWLSAAAGQQLFYPPNVAGWDFTRWLDTSTAKARWEMATWVTSNSYPNPWPGQGEARYSETETPEAALASAMAYWSQPGISQESLNCIGEFAEDCLEGVATAKWQQSPYRAIRQNALRMLIATSPDMQVS